MIWYCFPFWYKYKNIWLICFILDINECETGDNNCDVNANCLNNDGSFTCKCKEGYSGDGTNCEGK